MASETEHKRQPHQQRLAREAAEHARQLRNRAIGGIVAAIVILAVVFALANGRGGSHARAGAAGAYPYSVGAPAAGAPAPPIQLSSTTGGQFNLAAEHGHSVLLYFQEGLTCQPCWTQLVDIQKNISQFQAAGVDQVVTITVDPLGDLRQKVSDEGLSMPVLSDPGLVASREYSASQYGMMGTSRDGHSFVLVGPDGRIRWRADYGGPPNYTMYVPVSNLLADLRKGTNAPPA